jgi:MoaA/NifB/PqqE/SkfB family radical SAM enzyme
MHPPRDFSYYSRGINIDVSNKCILQCPSCERQLNRHMVDKASDITLDNYQKIIDVFPTVIMCGQISDPIYHSKFLELLKESKNLTRLIVCTNGSGKKRDWWREAFEIGIKNNNTTWEFALDGLPDESHIYRINQDGKEVWEVMKMGKEMGATISWQYIPFLYNENHIDEAEQMAIEHDIDFIVKISGRHPAGMRPSKKELRIDKIKTEMR